MGFFKLLLSAEVVKWQTRTFEGRVAQAVRVQVPPSAPNYLSLFPPCWKKLSRHGVSVIFKVHSVFLILAARTDLPVVLILT